MSNAPAADPKAKNEDPNAKPTDGGDGSGNPDPSVVNQKPSENPYDKQIAELTVKLASAEDNARQKGGALKEKNAKIQELQDQLAALQAAGSGSAALPDDFEEKLAQTVERSLEKIEGRLDQKLKDKELDDVLRLRIHDPKEREATKLQFKTLSEAAGDFDTRLRKAQLLANEHSIRELAKEEGRQEKVEELMAKFSGSSSAATPRQGETTAQDAQVKALLHGIRPSAFKKK